MEKLRITLWHFKFELPWRLQEVVSHVVGLAFRREVLIRNINLDCLDLVM